MVASGAQDRHVAATIEYRSPPGVSAQTGKEYLQSTRRARLAVWLPRTTKSVFSMGKSERSLWFDLDMGYHSWTPGCLISSPL